MLLRSRSRDVFTREAQEARSISDPGWNPRRKDFWLTLWTVQSKIEDLRWETEKVLNTLRPMINDAETKLENSLCWGPDKFREYGDELERACFMWREFYLKKLTVRYEVCCRRLENIICRATQHVLIPSALSGNGPLPPPSLTLTIRDPALSARTIREFVESALQSNIEMTELKEEYEELLLVFLENNRRMLAKVKRDSRVKVFKYFCSFAAVVVGVVGTVAAVFQHNGCW
jgi:hypothetical protein